MRKMGGNEQMTGKEYQMLASRTINQELSINQLMTHSILGMCGEVGEIQSIFQKAFQGHEIDEEKLKNEVGDLAWFIAEFCTAHKWDLDEILLKNIQKH